MSSDDTARFKREQLKARVFSFMASENKPLCRCGQLAMIGSKHCGDCLEKLSKLSNEELLEVVG